MTDNRNLTIRQDTSPIARMKVALSSESVQQQFKNALRENSNLFVASIIDLFGADNYLQKCEPKLVIMEALKAATLKLLINKALGFYYIVPFKKGTGPDAIYIPVGIVGYKGYLQLAQRTGQYKYINAGVIYEGETVEEDKLTGAIFFGGEPKNDKAIGYFAYIETINGFRKPIYWTRSKVDEHAKKYSKSYYAKSTPWRTEFDAMAIKTVLRNLLSKHGVMSVDMVGALEADSSDFNDPSQAPLALPENNHGQKNISYEPTRKAPKGQVVDFKKQGDNLQQDPQPESSRETDEPPPAPPEDKVQPESTKEQDQTNQDGDSNGQSDGSDWEDEFGTPSDHPLFKKSWFHMRAGSFKEGTGFKFYMHSNREYLKDLSDKAFACIFDKYQKLYSSAMPWGRYGEILPDADPEISKAVADKSDPHINETDNKVTLLNSDIAKRLAEQAKQYPEFYREVVAGRTPENMEQLITWVEQINSMAVNARLNGNL